MTTKHWAILVLLCLAAAPVFAAHFAAPEQVAPTVEVTAEVTAAEECAAEAMATEEATAEASATAEVTPEATDATLLLVGDPACGKLIFENGLNGAPACANCHVATGKTPPFALAPSLMGISARAATRIPGMTAPQYIEDSIRHPSHYVVSGFNPIMYSLFSQKYSDQDIADLIAYLMTL